MKRRVAVIALLLVLGASAPHSAGRPTGGNAVAFVAAEAQDRLVAVQLSPRRILKRFAVADGPHNVATSQRFVLVTSPPAGRITVVDAFRLRVVRTLGRLSYPHDVEVLPGGRYAFVTEERGNRIAVVSLATRRVVRRVAVPARPHDLALSPNGRRVWVTHGPDQGAMTILDTTRPARTFVRGSIRAHGASHDIAFAPDGRRVWVTYWGSNRVGAFDARSGRLLFSRTAGRLLHHVAAGERVWVTDHEGGRAFVLSPGDGRVVRAVAVGPSPHHVAFYGSFAAVVSHDAGTMSVFVARNGQRSGPPFRVGRALHGIAVAVVP
jgi:DNA-binding beta-propeller fold protein YncE